jgi:hypothetical protein
MSCAQPQVNQHPRLRVPPKSRTHLRWFADRDCKWQPRANVGIGGCVSPQPPILAISGDDRSRSGAHKSKRDQSRSADQAARLRRAVGLECGRTSRAIGVFATVSACATCALSSHSLAYARTRSASRGDNMLAIRRACSARRYQVSASDSVRLIIMRITNPPGEGWPVEGKSSTLASFPKLSSSR